ncbi:hypothetical protein BZARG_2598 [Bizionia argentinensis JUB59]|uniref:DUF4412 domain-containing protein n=1 Tax=Bizionia argentinensis JUB59 TaxID=1046627 RepID=G2ED56_9FLAO|nr:hypothetical protein [Bizionia argentinensis]EGV43609.1 hypothetical protein BZARG_2598 [Bizionia argentinensis JUB59]
MKNLLFALVLTFTLSGFAQEAMQEGVITSKQSMSSDSEQMQAQLAMIGDMKTTTYFKGDKTRSETSNVMSGNTTTILNGETKEMLMFLENQKLYASASIEADAETMKNFQITKGDETKTVLGYECQEYNVSVEKDGATVVMDIYVTDKIAAMNQQVAQMGSAIKGFPLYMKIDVNQSGMNMTITNEVTEIKKETVSEDKFNMTPPEGYKKTDNLTGM